MPDKPDPFRWREPATDVPLRWGGYRTRMLGGVLLIVGGGIAVAGGGVSSPFATALLYAGSLAHITGWSVLPSAAHTFLPARSSMLRTAESRGTSSRCSAW